MMRKLIALALFFLMIAQLHASEAEEKAAEPEEHELPYIFPGVDAILGAIGMVYFAAVILTLPKYLAEEKEAH